MELGTAAGSVWVAKGGVGGGGFLEAGVCVSRPAVVRMPGCGLFLTGHCGGGACGGACASDADGPVGSEAGGSLQGGHLLSESCAQSFGAGAAIGVAVGAAGGAFLAGCSMAAGRCC